MNELPADIDRSSREFFDARYRAQEDPWSFATNRYELDRYGCIVASLGGHTWDSAFEPGCSVGVLTAMLAPLCRGLLATDLSPIAIDRARHRCAALDHVTFRCESLMDTEPQPWALVVLSEIGYYFSARAWRQLTGRLIAALPVGSTVLASHWLGNSPDHRMHGDEVHAILRGRQDLHLTHSERHPAFRLDVWRKR